jgi:hypothetical protein
MLVQICSSFQTQEAQRRCCSLPRLGHTAAIGSAHLEFYKNVVPTDTVALTTEAGHRL